MLAFLIYSAGKEISRERLIDLFWSDRAQKQGQDSLRQALRAIRISLGEMADDILSVDRSHIMIHPGLLQTDLSQTEGQTSPKVSGTFLENLDSISPVFDDWLVRTRRETRNRQISNLERRLAKLDGADEADERLRCAKAVLALDPLNEPVARTAMIIHSEQGQIGHARRIYEMLYENLRTDDLDVSNETRDLLSSLSSGVATNQSPNAHSTGSISSDRGTPFVDVSLSQTETDQAREAAFVSDFYDRLLTRLTQMPEIRVGTREKGQTSDSYKLLVSSGMRPTGFRVSLRLIAGDSQLIWSSREDMTLEPDDETVQVSVDKLLVQMLPALEEHIFLQIDGKPVTAYGNFLFSKRIFSTAPSEDYVDRVLGFLERAVELDPEFIPPYSHLVMNYNTAMFMSQPGVNHSASRKKAFELSQRLLFLNSKHANSHISMGWCLLWRYKFDAAERSIRRAMDLNPHDPHKLNVVGTALIYLGHHDEGERYYEMAQDRLHHDFDFQRTDYGELYVLKKDYEAALSWMEISEIRSPYKTYFWRVPALAQLGRLREAEINKDSFIEDMRQRWRGPDPFVPEHGFQWYCDLLPLRTQSDRHTLFEGFQKAGVALTVKGLA